MNEYELVQMVAQVVRKADVEFEKVGGSTRHWVRDCFLPFLDEQGLMIVEKSHAEQEGKE